MHIMKENLPAKQYYSSFRWSKLKCQNDLTNLKTTIDHRFGKIEETVQKMHTELKLKLFEGVVDNLDRNTNNNPNESLSLNFDKENQQKGPYDKKEEEQTPWKDVIWFYTWT